MLEEHSSVQQFVADSVQRTLTAVSAKPLPSSKLSTRSAPLDIAIPIFNNAEKLRRCLDSLLPTLSTGDEVWLLDDASTEPEIPALLSEFSQHWPATHLIRNSHNLGFVGNANRAFSLTHRDIVLLNSDTEVARHWLEHLQACLHRIPKAGLVCPLSNRATILSVVPDSDTSNRSTTAAVLEESTIGDVYLPTAVGFCMLMRRQLLDEIGWFSDAFAPGYGEENDLSMRALKAGWDILAADQACVFHHAGGSFGRERSRALQRSHQARLDRLWPEYAPLVQAWWRDNPLRIRTEQAAWQGDERSGVVHVLHRQYHVGGTERVTRTLIRALRKQYRHTLLYPGETAGAWCDFELRSTELCRELMLNKRWIRPKLRIAGHGADISCAHSERALARIIQGHAASIVHLHHPLHWDSLLLPEVVQALGSRVVISVHDFWFNCPVHNQLEYSRSQPCGRSHAHADTRCIQCLQAYKGDRKVGNAAATDLSAFAEIRHALIHQALTEADAVLVPSHFIFTKLLAAYPMANHSHVHVLQQGVSLADKHMLAPGAKSESGLVIAYLGGDQVLKGAELVLQMAQAMENSEVTFRIHGRIKGFSGKTLPSNVQLPGFYNPDDVGKVLADVDLVLLPTHYEESFCMVASECWAHGVPVLASDRGALQERVIEGVNGWLVPDMTPASWIKSLQSILQGVVLTECRERLTRYPVTSIEQSSAALDDLYQNLLQKPARQPTTEPGHATANVAPDRFKRKVDELRAGRLTVQKPNNTRCLGIVRDHWGTANYRLRFPLQELARSAVAEGLSFHSVQESGFDIRAALQQAGPRHVVIQPFISDQGLKLMETLHREPGLRLTLVVDDLWTAIPDDNPVRRLMPEDIPGRLKYAASLCQSLVLTTAELQQQLGLNHDHTHIINNALPERFWQQRTPPNKPPEKPRQRLRIGWVGAPQHGADLAFLEPVMWATVDRADWVFMGMCPAHLTALAAEVHNMVPFDQYPSALAALDLDLAIAPLADNPFNQCKSHLKVLEYGILGLPVVACDLMPYRHCPVPLAAADQPDDWIDKIGSLLDRPGERLKQGQALQQWVLNNHLSQHRNPDWATALGIKDIAD